MGFIVFGIVCVVYIGVDLCVDVEVVVVYYVGIVIEIE